MFSRFKFVRRLGGRIFMTFALALILLSLLFGFFTTHFGGQLVSGSSANELRVLSVVLSELIQNQFSNLEGSLDEITSSDELLNQISDKMIQRTWVEAYLREQLTHHSHLTDVMIYDMDGRCVGATDPDWYKIRGKSWQFFQRGLEGFNFPPIYGADYGTEGTGRVQLVSAPITRGGVTLGAIVAIIDLGDIYQLMDNKVGLTETTDAFLLDSDLRFITAGRLGKKGLVESHLVSTTLASHLKDEFWVGDYAGSDGSRVLGTALKIPGYSWYVVVERNYDDVLRQIISLRRVVVLTTLGLLIVFILASLGVSRSITRPLLQLVQATRKIAAGKYNEPVAVSQEIEEVAFIGAELERMRRRIEVSQERLKERLTESEQLRIESERLAAIGTLAASLAHEIRNPLNAMSLLLSRLQYSASSDTRDQIMGDLFGEVGRLDRLVSSILDYARPIAIERTTVQVRGVLDSVVDLFRGIADSKGVRFEVDASDGLMLQADPDSLKQCLVNLVKNSLDAIAGGGVIRLASRETKDEVIIEVSDDGTGIQPEIQAKLFSPFFTTKDHGTGLGLSSVHKIIAGHGGRIDVVSNPGKIIAGTLSRGAEFIIRIPTL